MGFNPLDRGNLNQIKSPTYVWKAPFDMAISFNPLDRGNLNQITSVQATAISTSPSSFNPLDRGNLNQIA